MGSAGHREDLEHAIFDGKEGDLEGTTAKIVSDDLGLVVPLIETISDGGYVR